MKNQEDIYCTVHIQYSTGSWRTDRGNRSIANRYTNVEIGNDAAQFHFWEYINRIIFSVCLMIITLFEAYLETIGEQRRDIDWWSLQSASLSSLQWSHRSLDVSLLYFWKYFFSSGECCQSCCLALCTFPTFSYLSLNWTVSRDLLSLSASVKSTSPLYR